MQYIVREKMYLLLIYVEDILLSVDEESVKCMESIFLQEFTWFTMQMSVILKDGPAVG
jgi:hypothetical protein